MDKYFFSEKNVGDLTKKLILNLQLSEDQINKDVVVKCKKIIVNHMNETYDKYANIKPESISTRNYIGKMNNKSLKDCLRVFDVKKNEKHISSPNLENNYRKNYASENIPLKPALKKNNDQLNYNTNNSNQQFLRPNEIMNNFKNPNHPQQNNNPSKEYQSFNDTSGYASFNKETPSGPFITATGEYGMPLESENNMQFPEQSGRKNYAEEIEQKMSALNSQYGGGGGFGQNMSTAQNMNQGSMGGNGFYGVPNGGQQNQPGDINPNVAKWLNLDPSSIPGAPSPPPTTTNNNGNLENQLNMLKNQLNQLQQSGQVNPQLLQQMVQQMNQMQQQISSNNGTDTISTANTGQMGFNQGQMNPNVDYSFTAGNETMGNDLNSAFGTNGNNGYSGHDSLDNSFKDIQPQNMSNSMSGTTNNNLNTDQRLDMMKSERSKGLDIQKNDNFDPMKSPYQMNQEILNNKNNNNQNNNNQNNNNQSNSNNFDESFFFLNNKKSFDENIKKISSNSKKKDKKTSYKKDKKTSYKKDKKKTVKKKYDKNSEEEMENYDSDELDNQIKMLKKKLKNDKKSSKVNEIESNNDSIKEDKDINNKEDKDINNKKKSII